MTNITANDRSTATIVSPAGPYADAFGPFDGRTWLNAAHQGPLPRVAAAAAREAIAQKLAPHHIPDSAFTEVPRRLRDALSRLIGAAPGDVVLGNSASYGLDLLAHALPWRAGDEVLFVNGEFPATVFPWRVLERRGVRLRFFTPRAGGAPEVDELVANLTPRTCIFCASWVNSFSGHALDLDAVGRACQAAGVRFVLNASQGLGARAMDVSQMPLDALTCCGYKWLLGPYGTGFCWLSPELRDVLTPPHTYWLPNVWERPGGLRQYTVREDVGVQAFDVFCTANFLNFAPWAAAVEYLLGAGPAAVERYDQWLVGRLVAQLDSGAYELLSPADGRRRSTLVVLRPVGGRTDARTGPPDVSAVHRTLAAAGVDVAVREGTIRLSPHLYNGLGDIDRAATALRTAAGRVPQAPASSGDDLD